MRRSGDDNIYPGDEEMYDGRDDERFLDISLRDWFAGRALTGMIIAYKDALLQDCVDDAYRYADLMMKKRAGKELEEEYIDLDLPE